MEILMSTPFFEIFLKNCFFPLHCGYPLELRSPEQTPFQPTNHGERDKSENYFEISSLFFYRCPSIGHRIIPSKVLLPLRSKDSGPKNTLK
jgi:hypothetical protein